MDAQTQFAIGKSLGLANNSEAMPVYVTKIEGFKKQAIAEVHEAASMMQEITKGSITMLEAEKDRVFGTFDEIAAKMEKMLSLLVEYRQKLSNDDLNIKKMFEQIWDMAEKKFQSQLNQLESVSPLMEEKITEAVTNIRTHADVLSKKLTVYAEAIATTHTDITDLQRGYLLGNALREVTQ